MNPFREVEESLGQLETQQAITKEIRKTGFRETMKTPQYSEHHTEGEGVASHYRLIFDVVSAIQHEGDERFMERLPKFTREKLSEIDPIVKHTIRQYPGVMRYAIMVHDIAKQSQSRMFKFPDLHLPEQRPGGIDDEQWSALEGFLTKGLSWNAKDKTPDSPDQAEARDLHDHLLALGFSGEQIKQMFGMDVRFYEHERRSGELVSGMEIPDQIKKVLFKLAAEHMKPLLAFSDHNITYYKKKLGANAAEDKVCNKIYRERFKDYSNTELRLAMALFAVDKLGSLPENGEYDLRPMHRALAANRRVWVGDMIEKNKRAVFNEILSKRYPSLMNKRENEMSQAEESKYFALQDEVLDDLKNRYTKQYQEMMEGENDE